MGWVGCSPISTRGVYAGVVEDSIFVDPMVRGMGVGRLLLEAFVRQSERRGIWTIQAGVFPENEASLRLHEAAGFRIVGVRERIGQMLLGPLAGQWRDVVLLERRSTTVGRWAGRATSGQVEEAVKHPGAELQGVDRDSLVDAVEEAGEVEVGREPQRRETEASDAELVPGLGVRPT